MKRVYKPKKGEKDAGGSGQRTPRTLRLKPIPAAMNIIKAKSMVDSEEWRKMAFLCNN